MPTTSIVSSAAGTIVDVDGDSRLINVPLDEVFVSDDPAAYVASVWADGSRLAANELTPLPPIGTQEVWAAGVTYEVSRTARMEESEAAADVYERVYDAERPELFFKANARSVVGAEAAIRVRADSSWNVPEPELALAVSRSGRIFGVTVGNDVSSRSIEGENPLYLPQAKIYDGACALGPRLVLTDDAGGWPAATSIRLTIERDAGVVFDDATTTARIRRPFSELAEYLCREMTFPAGAYLLTGAGLVPEAPFTLLPGDVVSITIDGIGTLTNPVARPR